MGTSRIIIIMAGTSIVGSRFCFSCRMSYGARPLPFVIAALDNSSALNFRMLILHITMTDSSYTVLRVLGLPARAYLAARSWAVSVCPFAWLFPVEPVVGAGVRFDCGISFDLTVMRNFDKALPVDGKQCGGCGCLLQTSMQRTLWRSDMKLNIFIVRIKSYIKHSLIRFNYL